MFSAICGAQPPPLHCAGTNARAYCRRRSRHRETLGILIRSEGFDVELAHGGAQVLEAVREFRPHAILLDIGMPDGSGHEIALALTRQYGASCPVLVAVTARTGDSEKRLAKANGFRYYIPKPCDPDLVLALRAQLKTKL